MMTYRAPVLGRQARRVDAAEGLGQGHHGYLRLLLAEYLREQERDRLPVLLVAGDGRRGDEGHTVGRQVAGREGEIFIVQG
jgi:hypothetical protein